MLKEKNTKIISGFPGIGKSCYCNNTDLNVLDSDSSNFSQIKEGVRNPEFPQNYINHIKEHIGKVDIILVSSHLSVREALAQNNITFTLVYPSRELKDQYISRFKERGSSPQFIKLLSKNWEIFIEELENQTKCEHIILTKGEYLSTYVKF